MENESNILFEKFFSISRDLLCITDMQGNFIKVNDSWKKVLGYEKNELLNLDYKNFQNIVDINFRDIISSENNKKGTLNNLEVKIICKDKTELCGLLSGEIFESKKQNLLLAVIKDITNQRGSEKQLDYYDKILAAVAYSIKELLDNHDYYTAISKCFRLIGEATMVDRVYLFENYYDNENKRFSSHTIEWTNVGVEPQIENPELQNLPFEEIEYFINPLLKKEAFCSVISKVEDYRIKELMDMQNILSLIVLPVFSGDNFWGYIGFDECKYEKEWSENEFSILVAFANALGKAVERNKIENDLKIARKEADNANKAKSRFVANMSHEIRTPLNGISGAIELLSNTGISDEQINYINILKHSSKTLLNIVNDILDLSKIEAGKLEIVKTESKIREIIFSTVSMFIIQAKKKNIEIDVDIDSEIPEIIFADAIRIEQILLNLINNSIKFTPKGKIKLILSNYFINSDRHIKFTVQDTGIGISKEQQKLLFQPFVQSDNAIAGKFGGTGLGLSICKKLVNLMGGDIHLESEIDIGTKIDFTIMIEENINNTKNHVETLKNDTYCLNNIERKENEILTGLISNDKKSSLSKSLKILIVEDNEINQIILCKNLEKFGHDTIIAKSGREALKLNKNIKFDLIFMDVQLPDMDGYMTTKEIRNSLNGRSIPIVAVTAYAMNDDRERCLHAGMDDFISKPIDFIKLKSIIYKVKLNLKYNEIVDIDDINIDLGFENLESDIDFFIEIVKKFKKNSKRLIIEINKSIKIRDNKQLKISAHTLKGLVAIFYCKKAYELAKILEEAGDESYFDDLSTYINELEIEIIKLINLLDEFIRGYFLKNNANYGE